jgi:hypothetical protein
MTLPRQDCFFERQNDLSWFITKSSVSLIITYFYTLTQAENKEKCLD